ncbi:hypothetical protein ACF073_07440 [Streptomyces sp. NPDC015171]|uniref:hypothetical protein n=1 Tax=Streptomyces sp. NPDC015171 TaxID=3364945 RepID=UPI0037025853
MFRAGLDLPSGESPERRTDVELPWSGLPEPIDLHLDGDWFCWTDRGAPPDGNTLNRAAIRQRERWASRRRSWRAVSPRRSGWPSASPTSLTWADTSVPSRCPAARPKNWGNMTSSPSLIR